MTQIPFQDGKVVFRDGTVGTGQECCCEKDGACCLPDGTCVSGLTQEQCEECTPTYSCFDEETFEEYPVADCSECSGFCYETGTEGQCGVFKPGKSCEQAPCCVGSCETVDDCAEGCDCPCEGEKTEEFAIIRGNIDFPQEIDDTIAFLESIGYRNVRHEYQEEFLSDTWLGTCCGSWCSFTNGWTIGIVPYNVCGCSNTRACTENPLP